MNKLIKFSTILLASTALGFCCDDDQSNGGIAKIGSQVATAPVLTDDFDLIDSPLDVEFFPEQQARPGEYVVNGVVLFPQQAVYAQAMVEVEPLTRAVNTLTAVLEANRNELAGIKAELAYCRQEAIRYQDILREKDIELRQQTAAHANAQGKLDTLAAQLIELRAALAIKEEALGTAGRDRDAALRDREVLRLRMEDFNERIREITQQRDAAQAVVNNRLVELAQAHTGVAHLNDQLREVRGDLDRRTIERDGALNERNHARALVEGLMAEQNADRERITNLIAQLNATQGERDAFRLERDNANVLVATRTAERDGFKAERDAANILIVKCTGERDLARKQGEDLQLNLESLVADLASKTAAFTRAEENLAIHGARILQQQELLKKRTAGAGHLVNAFSRAIRNLDGIDHAAAVRTMSEARTYLMQAKESFPGSVSLANFASGNIR